MDLEAGIWALRLRYGPGGGGEGEEEEKEEKEEEKIPLCESIGHRPLWGRCPKIRLLPKSGGTQFLQPFHVAIHIQSYVIIPASLTGSKSNVLT